MIVKISKLEDFSSFPDFVPKQLKLQEKAIHLCLRFRPKKETKTKRKDFFFVVIYRNILKRFVDENQNKLKGIRKAGWRRQQKNAT